MQSSRPLCSRWLGKALTLDRCAPVSELPFFLCPAIRPTPFAAANQLRDLGARRREFHSSRTKRSLHAHVEPPSTSNHPVQTSAPPKKTKTEANALPTQCYGCGAFSQTMNPEEAGYFDMQRKAVKVYLGLQDEARPSRRDNRVVEDALQSVDAAKLMEMGFDLSSLTGDLSSHHATVRPAKFVDKPPLCDRCHQLSHHRSGKSIAHPTIESIRDTIEETPFKHNHVYHVVDAADFPMSLLPRINQLLDLAPLRTKNRRSQTSKFHQGRKIEMTIIITRSDLLAPRKEQVDSLMHYIQNVLRDALGRSAKNVRLGNVRCVSAKTNWWIKELREEIWDRGGAGWMVGRVNVGKSQLFEGVFPKGRMDWKPPKHQITIPMVRNSGVLTPPSEETSDDAPAGAVDPFQILDAPGKPDILDEFSLLPPAQEETNYPDMPLVSSLPGTTASPIRIPFGGGKGELIDLPGFSRGDLELHVKEKHRASLVMKSRITPEQQILKPGKSLLLGGFIRITPRTPDLTFLAYNFTPLQEHITATDKAASVQEQADDAPNVENISLPGTGAKIKHAGTFALSYDVTKKRTGPITLRNAVGISVDRLPYRVLSLDLLVEGCGWVEIVAQVRTKHLFAPKERPKPSDPGFLDTLDLSAPIPDPGDVRAGASGEPNWPLVDVFSPEGRFIGSREPMNGWLLNKPKARKLKQRPRKSMKGAKKQERAVRRVAEALQASN